MNTFARAFAWLYVVATILTTQVLVASPVTQGGLIPQLLGAPAKFGNGTYPRANKLADGSLIGIYTKFHDNVTSLTITHSTDGGHKWADLSVVASKTTATHDLDNPFVLQLPSGKVLAACRNHDRKNATDYVYFRITIFESQDNGHTWRFLSQIERNAHTYHGLWEPFLRNARDGTLQLYYSSENNKSDQDSLMRTSHDGGTTWSSPNTIGGGDHPASRDGMLGVASIGAADSNGPHLLAVFETETNGGQFTIGAIESCDDGCTWGHRRTVFTPSKPKGDANAPQIANVGGKLVVSLQTTEDDPSTDPAAKVITSGDGGHTWGHKTTYFTSPAYWPCLVVLDDKTFLGIADHNGAKAQRMTLT